MISAHRHQIFPEIWTHSAVFFLSPKTLNFYNYVGDCFFMSVSKLLSQYVLYTFYLHRKTKSSLCVRNRSKQINKHQNLLNFMWISKNWPHKLFSQLCSMGLDLTMHQLNPGRELKPGKAGVWGVSGEHKPAPQHQEFDFLTEQKVTQLWGSVLVISHYGLSRVSLQ